MSSIYRGDIYYVVRSYTEEGSEQQAGRPAIVVSNDVNNANSNVVEVVYLTTKVKANLPTHCTILSSGRESTALCEQVHSVYKDRLESYISRATPDEMADVDRCICESLGLRCSAPVGGLMLDTTQLVMERDFYKQRYEEILDRLIGR